MRIKELLGKRRPNIDGKIPSVPPKNNLDKSMSSPHSPFLRKEKKDVSMPITTRRLKQESPPTFAIKTKKRPNSMAEKIHVEISASKDRMKNENLKMLSEKKSSDSPFSCVNQVKLGRVRAETASITCLEKISNTPLRSNKVYSKSPCPRSSPKRDVFDSCANSNDRFNAGRPSTSLGFVEDNMRELASSSSSETLEDTDSNLDLINVSHETLNETSFDDGYHTLRSADTDDPWSTYETDVLNATNEDIFSSTKLRSTPNLYDAQRHLTTFDNDAENCFYNDQSRISAIKRRSKNARYSVHQPLSDHQNAPLAIGSKFASEVALSRCPSRKTSDRKRRSKEINRSTTLYWDGHIEEPTLPENIVFNVSMNAKIQTYYKDTILHSAAANGNRDIVQFYAASDQYLNTQNGFRNTPLHCAILGKHDEIIDILLNKGLDLTLQNIDGDTALHLLLRAELTKYIERSATNDNVNLQNKDGDTGLHIAVRQNMKDAIMTILKQKPLLRLQNNVGDTPLHICKELDDDSKLKLLEPIVIHKHNHVSGINELDANKENHTEKSDYSNDCVVNIANNKGETLLHTFTSNNDVPILTQILALKCTKTKVKNKKGETALHLAAKQSIDLIKLVVQEDLELLNIGDGNEDTILHYAVKASDLALTEELLQLGININGRNKVGNTALHISVIGRNIAILQLLLSKNADLNARNEDGDGPLHFIVGCQDKEIYQIISELHLMQSHADIIKALCMRNGKGNNPIHEAVIKNDAEFFRIFRDFSNWFIKSVNASGDTILHLIAEHNRARFLRYVAMNDMDVNAVNNEGLSAWNIAIQSENSDIAMFLLKLKWNLNVV